MFYKKIFIINTLSLINIEKVKINIILFGLCVFLYVYLQGN